MKLKEQLLTLFLIFSFSLAAQITTSEIRIEQTSNSSVEDDLIVNGKLGIGNSSPGLDLDIKRHHADVTAIHMENQNPLGRSFVLTGEGNLGRYIYMGYNNSNHGSGGGTGVIFTGAPNGLLLQSNQHMSFYSGGSDASHERIRITTAGNLGIGITSPRGQLSLKNQIPGSLEIYSATNGLPGQSILNSYYVHHGGDVGPYPRILDIASVGSPDGTNGGGVIRFLTNPITTNAPAVERMRISSDGKVGIGKTNPYFDLDVAGRINANGMLLGDGNGTRLQGPSGMGFRASGSGSNHMTILSNGNIGIGTSNPISKLHVNGDIRSSQNHWADFVFEENYDLPTLAEVEEHIKEKGHLLEIPSEEEVVKNGYVLGDMDAKLLQKIEELTLYLIEQNKRIAALEKELQKRNQ